MRLSTAAARRVRVAARIAVAAVSIAVLAVTALGWYQVQALNRSTPVAQVIPGPPPAVSAEQNILLVGVDARTDALGRPLPPDLLDALHAGSSSDGGDTADTLIVVHVPEGGGRATAISIPRDSYVDLGGGLGKHKINSAYSRASQAVLDASPGGSGTSRPSSPDQVDPALARAAATAGARATVVAVETLTQLHITHYAAVNLVGFADLSQAIGGVPVCLRAPVSDPYSGAMLPAGPQDVAGAQALAFVRQRHGLPNGDLDRIARQQVFLAGVTERLLSGGTLTNPFAMSRLSDVVSRSVTLDSGWDVLAFARQLQGLQAGQVTFRTIPTGTIVLPTPEDGTAVQVFPDAVRAFVPAAIADDAEHVQATAAPASSLSTPTPTPTDVAVTRPIGPAQVRAQGASSGASSTAPVPPPITAAEPGCVN